MDRRNKPPKQLSAERREVLLSAAARLFHKRGFGGCSVDHIARESGVSKSTIYRQFANKEAIFEEVQLRVAEKQARLINAFIFDEQQPAQSLKAFARYVYQIDSQPEFLESFRLLLSIAGRMPEMADRIRSQGATEVLSRLTSFFQKLIDSGKVEHPDSRQAAVTFYVLARGNFRPLLGASPDVEREMSIMLVDIGLFLKGVGLLPVIDEPFATSK